MSDGTTGKTLTSETGTNWERLRNIRDAELKAAIAADPDAPGTDEAFWQSANVVMPQRKETITLRLDADILAWLRQERGYQTRINAILRTYMKVNAPHA